MSSSLQISFELLSNASTITTWRTAYFDGLVAPMDGMWDSGFTQPSPHWSILLEGSHVGYFVLNEENALLQFYIDPKVQAHSPAILERIVSEKSVSKAVVSTIDPAFLSLCLTIQKKVTVHTLLFEPGTQNRAMKSELPTHVEVREAAKSELETVVAFQIECLGGQQELKGWLDGYSSHLISRDEIFVFQRDGEWVGLGEYRKSDSQSGVVDLGVMIHPSHRRQGLAASVLSYLGAKSMEEGLRSICSTTLDNPASEAAIRKAGFVSNHRIMDVDLA